MNHCCSSAAPHQQHRCPQLPFSYNSVVGNSRAINQCRTCICAEINHYRHVDRKLCRNCMFVNITPLYLSLDGLQLFLQVASCLLVLLLLLQQGVLLHLQLADLAAQIQLLARFLLPQLLKYQSTNGDDEQTKHGGKLCFFLQNYFIELKSFLDTNHYFHFFNVKYFK